MGLSAEARGALVWVGADFDTLTSGGSVGALDAPSEGTRWTNRELLFHMWFGQRIARVFIPMIGGFSRLPSPVSRQYARLLTALSRPYEWVNYAGSVAGARVGGLARARRWMANDSRNRAVGRRRERRGARSGDVGASRVGPLLRALDEPPRSAGVGPEALPAPPGTTDHL